MKQKINLTYISDIYNFSAGWLLDILIELIESCKSPGLQFRGGL